MIQLSPLLLLPLFSVFNSIADASTEYLRPQIHLTPDQGWMNDPNGMFYDRKDKLWHVYFQHNPDKKSIWATPVTWGHSTSKDLLTWDYHGNALEPENDDEGIFSGSVVVDRNNTSGFFNDSTDPEQRIVAIYTNNAQLQTQEIAYSLDKGYSFIKYDQNPVINVNSSQQRDPKVLWHDESNQWIMVVAKTQEFKVQIYGSPDLKKWDLKSNFTSNGYLGFQYECPGLFKLPIENPLNDTVTSKWVLLLAINPGSPLGGSINEYFIGDFDGTTFHPDDGATRFMDIGKDFYAFQSFDNTEPEDGALGLAWASNWQYANTVPTENWRSSMSLVRNYTLKYVDVNPENYGLTLIQKPPVFDTKETRKNDTLKSIDTVNEYEVTDLKLDKYSNVATDFNSWRNSTGILEFTLKFTQTKFGFSYSNDTTFGIFINSQTVRGTQETLKVAFDALSSSWYVDRSTQHPFQRETSMFTERLSTYVEKMDESDDGIEFSLHGVVDRDILELYFNDGSIAMTSTFFFSQGKIPTSLAIVTDAEESFITINEFVVKELGFK
ncbi:glycoside hydrolase family 32 protein [Wickerhamomyces anomalus NRRL Y-366-8]|uniref:Glycoside hydrolase family 32 protein n=1 Tax=Wickerhamomyces anomalus (strain ATCC 58044 / CBS 1984 / NCYC 433 / NRRL Y-366-8) TaxID=683960 RepID=A0A1E3NWF7_WICAA|nr:glycoside hydrolase family 32 protein [Wickerhamomyces anomalus NRRL Y-366-8]ODQ57453.1 glycoside hydrolase family 32 protein [Wickerhamomyces anomalus NRRL Y-366-8]